MVWQQVNSIRCEGDACKSGRDEAERETGGGDGPEGNGGRNSGVFIASTALGGAVDIASIKWLQLAKSNAEYK